jgi:alpha-tubulin suppressor-like RCC1 family protein
MRQGRQGREVRSRVVPGVLVAVGLGLGGLACTSILGKFDVGPSAAPADASTDVVTSDSPAGDAGSDAGPALLTGAVQISAGARHTCALVAGDKVVCWGDNSSGQLGAPPAMLPHSALPVFVANIPAMKQVAAGASHTCALEKNNARVWCWGKNDCGQLGRGTLDPNPVPTPQQVHQTATANDVNAVSVACGAQHSCAVDSGGTLYCWGCNDSKQLGPPSGANSPLPTVTIGANYRVLSASAGAKDTCAATGAIDGVSTGAGIGCLGTEDQGALGDGLPASSVTTTVVQALPGASGANGGVQVSAGDAHTCAVDADQSLFCWGQNDFGQVGVVGGSRPAPAKADLTRKVTQVAAGGAFTCYVTQAKDVLCFGSDNVGQLGRGTTDNLPHPNGDTVLAGGKPMPADAITAGREHACAIVAGGILCWGSNSDGQIGDGMPGGNRPNAVPVGAPMP